jgi:hypothetical protein
MVLAALQAAGLAHREACRASHVAGLAAIAGAGGAVAALIGQAVPPDWRVLAPGEAGLPALPVCEAALLLPPEPTPLAGCLARALAGMEAGEAEEAGKAAGGEKTGSGSATRPSTRSAPA